MNFDVGIEIVRHCKQYFHCLNPKCDMFQPCARACSRSSTRSSHFANISLLVHSAFSLDFYYFVRRDDYFVHSLLQALCFRIQHFHFICFALRFSLLVTISFPFSRFAHALDSKAEKEKTMAKKGFKCVASNEQLKGDEFYFSLHFAAILVSCAFCDFWIARKTIARQKNEWNKKSWAQ